VNYRTAALGDVAPAKPIKINGYGANDAIWQVTLDHIESDTGRLLEKVIKPISEAGSSTHGFDKRHVLYSKLRPYLNKVLLPNEIGLGTTELVPMMPDPKTLDRVYLAHYLKSKAFVNWVSSQTAGAKMPRVSMQVFWEHQIPLPPLQEQKRIAAILDKADTIRHKRQHAIQLADDFLRAVFLDMFGDPITNPKEWPMSTFGEVFDVRDGTHDSPKYIDSGYPLVTSKNIKNGMLDLTDVNYISQDDYDSINKRSKVDIRDVLMPMIGTIGNPVIVNFEPNFAIKNVALIKTKNAKVPPEIVKMLLDGPLLNHAISSLGRGGTQKFLSLGDIRQLSCYLPDPRAIEKYLMINTKIQSLLKKYFEHENSEIFESISQKIFAGEF
jgi:type I restriction enzyme S subunit